MGTGVNVYRDEWEEADGPCIDAVLTIGHGADEHSRATKRHPLSYCAADYKLLARKDSMLLLLLNFQLKWRTKTMAKRWRHTKTNMKSDTTWKENEREWWSHTANKNLVCWEEKRHWIVDDHRQATTDGGGDRKLEREQEVVIEDYDDDGRRSHTQQELATSQQQLWPQTEQSRAEKNSAAEAQKGENRSTTHFPLVGRRSGRSRRGLGGACVYGCLRACIRSWAGMMRARRGNREREKSRSALGWDRSPPLPTSPTRPPSYDVVVTVVKESKKFVFIFFLLSLFHPTVTVLCKCL